MKEGSPQLEELACNACSRALALKRLGVSRLRLSIFLHERPSETGELYFLRRVF